MSHLTDLIAARRSVRRFTARPVSREELSAMVEAARWAPSACNAQPWRFVAVTDAGLRRSLVSRCLGGAVPNRWAEGAPAFLVAAAERRLVPHLLGEPVSGVPYHLVDLGIAMEHAVLRAVELGLGTCFIGWFKERPLKRLLGLPRRWKVVSLIAVGQPEATPPPSTRLGLDRILHFDGCLAGGAVVEES